MARAIYTGKPQYAAQRVRQMQDPVVVALAASLALGVLMNSQAAALRRHPALHPVQERRRAHRLHRPARLRAAGEPVASSEEAGHGG